VTTPTFFLAGAAKSGTTAVYAALGRHPDVFLPERKEPHYYAYLAAPDLVRAVYPSRTEADRHYRDLYAPVADERAVGDASTTNLVVPGAAAAIANDVPNARIVVVLRQPVDRAYAHYRHFVVAGGEPLPSFADAVRAEPTRRAQGFPFTYEYLGWGRYADQLQPFVERFGRDRVLVHLYDDLCADADGVMRATFAFLDVDADVPAIVPRRNVIRAQRRPRLSGALRALGRPGRAVADRVASATITPEPLDLGLRAELTASIDDDLHRLEDLVGRDLSAWRR
jgi:hypothetical protein